MDEVLGQESLKTPITAKVKNIPRNEWIKNFRNYKERLEYCKLVGGDYFEHLIK